MTDEELNKPSPEAQEKILSFVARNPGAVYHVYENQLIGDRGCGDRQYLAVGPGCTYQTAPDRMPDTKTVNWRFVRIGALDLKTWETVKCPA